MGCRAEKNAEKYTNACNGEIFRGCSSYANGVVCALECFKRQEYAKLGRFNILYAQSTAVGKVITSVLCHSIQTRVNTHYGEAETIMQRDFEMKPINLAVTLPLAHLNALGTSICSGVVT